MATIIMPSKINGDSVMAQVRKIVDSKIQNNGITNEEMVVLIVMEDKFSAEEKLKKVQDCTSKLMQRNQISATTTRPKRYFAKINVENKKTSVEAEV